MSLRFSIADSSQAASVSPKMNPRQIKRLQLVKCEIPTRLELLMLEMLRTVSQ